MNKSASRFNRSQPFRALRIYREERLTVLCYHRVADPRDDRFQGYKPNISVALKDFIQQIDYLRARYNPVSLRDVAAWLEGGSQLPPRPVLVTFDDGYRDNGDLAWPIMRDRRVPAVVFLATNHIGTGKPFLWDLAAYCFDKTTETELTIPLVGSVALDTQDRRDACAVAWVESAKRIPGSDREGALASLSIALNVPLPSNDEFQHLYLNWSDVQSLAEHGMEFGGHTCTHPILTTITLDEAKAEIEGSVRSLTAMLGPRPLGFAYPNGSPLDYTREHERIVKCCGVSIAFSLEPGPMLLSEVRERPMAVRRVYIGQQDNFPRFVAKLAGAARAMEWLRGMRSGSRYI